jgi:Luciferase
MTLSAQEQIRIAVSDWEGVTVASHRFGGIEFRYEKRELGHVHGNSLADLPFPMPVRNELIRQGLARPHHVLPESGWVSVPMKSQEDVATVIRLFRSSWELARQSKQTTRVTGESGEQESRTKK